MKNKQAFPGIEIVQHGNPAYDAPVRQFFSGMTLRDYFAAKAMQAMLSNPSYFDTMVRSVAEDISNNAYFIADKMLLERDK